MYWHKVPREVMEPYRGVQGMGRHGTEEHGSVE